MIWKDGRYTTKIGKQEILLGSVAPAAATAASGGVRRYFLVIISNGTIKEFQTQREAEKFVEDLFSDSENYTPIWSENVLNFKMGNHLFRVGSWLEKPNGFRSFDRRSFEDHESVEDAKRHLESSIPSGYPKWDVEGFFRVQDYVLASSKRTHSNEFSTVIFCSGERAESEFRTEQEAREFVEKELA